MRTVICPKCNSVIAVPDGKDFVICCGETIFVMSSEDSDIFFNELATPSKPNKALKKAASRYKKQINEIHDRETQE